MKLPNELRIFRYAEQSVAKQVKEEKETMASRATNLAKEQVASASTVTPAAVKTKKPIHYWHGTKLLGLEIRISTKLTHKLLKGGKLTRREQRQVSIWNFCLGERVCCLEEGGKMLTRLTL
jgi:LETM1 and EF-hand domain-containing protein 1